MRVRPAEANEYGVGGGIQFEIVDYEKIPDINWSKPEPL